MEERSNEQLVWAHQFTIAKIQRTRSNLIWLNRQPKANTNNLARINEYEHYLDDLMSEEAHLFDMLETRLINSLINPSPGT